MPTLLQWLFFRRVCFVGFAALLVAGPGGGFASEPTLPTELGRVVTLPPLMVEGKNAPVRWRYLELPGLEVLSVCDDYTTEEFVQRRLRLNELLHVLVPERFCARSSVPVAHILFNEATGRAQSQEIIREMVSKEGASLASDGTVTLPYSEQTAPTFGRLPAMRASPRISFLPNLRVSDMDATTVFAIISETNHPKFTFTPDEVEFFLKRRTPALPDWLIEGVLGLYRQAELHDDEVVVRPATWPSDMESAALQRDPKRPSILLPMQELLTRVRPGDGQELGETDRVWQLQCALLVRWALADKSGARKEAFWQFVERLETEPLSEALFQKHFGLGFPEARDRLGEYLSTALNQDLTLDAPSTVPLPRLKFRAATALEVARIRGDWERMEIAYVRQQYPALAGKYVEQARRTLHRVYDRGERDPQLLAILGLTEVDAGNPDGAREFLEAAVRGRVVRPRVYFELAQLRYKALPAASDTKLTDEQAAGVLGPLLATRRDDPPLPGIYALLAEVWKRSATPPTPENLKILNEGARLFPGMSAYVLCAIYLNVANGQVTPAAALADLGLRHARDPAMRERLERVREKLAMIKELVDQVPDR